MHHQRNPIRRLLAGALSLVLLSGCLGAAAAPGKPTEVTLGIYSTSDMHGRYYGQNPLDGAVEQDTYLKVSTAMNQERAQVDEAILIDGGDALDGSFLSWYGTAQRSAWDNPLAFALRYIGYDVFVPGEGEFRFTAQDRENFFTQLAAPQSTSGTPVAVLSANYLDTRTQAAREQPYQIFTVQAGERAFRIGVLGFSAMDVPGQVPAGNYSGTSFASADNTQGTYAWEWNNGLEKQLRETEQCDLVVVVCHSGLDEPGQVSHLVSNTTGIDLVVAGHDGLELTYSVNNADGAAVPVVSGGGTCLTKTVLTLRSDGTLAVGDSALLSLSGYENDKSLEGLLKSYYSEALSFSKQSVGTLGGTWDSKTGFLYQQTDTTDLVGRAMRWASGADLALVSPARLGEAPISAVLRQGSSAPVTWQDCYALYPNADSALYAVELTGAQLKAWLERSAQSYQVSADGTVTGGGAGTDLLYGLDYDLYLGGEQGAQAANMTYLGRPVRDDQVFKVAVDGFRLTDQWYDPYGWFAVTGIDKNSDKVVWRAAADRKFSAQSGQMPAVLAVFLQSQSQQYGYLAPRRESTWTVYPGAVDGPITRLELVSMLYERAGSPTPSADSAFIDVTDNSAVVWAAESGVVSGNGGGKFLPAQAVTREQAAVMLYGFARAQDFPAPTGGTLATSLLDYGQVSAWARTAVDYCLRMNIMPALGRGDIFQPQEPLTRVQAREILHNLEALP